MVSRGSMLALLVLSAGCQAWSPRTQADDPLKNELPGQGAIKSGFNRAGRFLSGKEQIDADRAKQWYLDGDREFRVAAGMSRGEADATFVKAGDRFLKAAEAAPGSALQQDALYMAGESYFFANRLNDARDAYEKLQTDHPRNRHSERTASRLFEIGNYLIEAGVADESRVIAVNFTDDSRPWFDSGGHGLKILDKLRYDDPTGRLSDDATMRQAVEHMRQGNWFEADQLFTDLREVYPDSDHQFNAYKLGLRCKLEMYAGPSYSEAALKDARELIERMKIVFPAELNEPENREFISQAEHMVTFLQAEKLWKRALYREKQGNYGGAAEYLQAILEKYPSTPFAENARQHLEANADKPQTRPQRLSFLSKLFPSAQPQKPLLSPNGSILRR